MDSRSTAEPAVKGTYSFVSLGCPKNLVDSERMLGLLAQDGYVLVPEAERADLVIINTCGFIDAARQESLGVIRDMLDRKRSGTLKGVVVAEVVIDTSGSVTDAKIVQSIPLLDEAALQAVRNWHYAPTMVNGQPVPVRMNVTVNFTLPPTPPRSTAPPR